MQEQYISLADLRKVSGIGDKTIERIKAQLLQNELDSNYKSEYNANIKLDINNIYQGDCLELMNGIRDKSIDMVLCDLPYGTTRNKWDSTINLNKLWMQYNRIIKDRGAIVLFGNEPFTTSLISSNLNMFKYKITWVKTVGSGQMNCNYAPLKLNEDILVFSNSASCYVKDSSSAMTYIPQFSKGEPYKIKRNIKNSDTYDYQKEHESVNDGYRYPTDVICFPNPRVKDGHPTQKPVDLCEYLINTYTHEGGLVLDNCIGSGTTAISAINANRNYIGIELDENYYNIAKNRINEYKSNITLK